MGLFDLLASVVEGAGQIGATHVMVKAADSAVAKAEAQQAAEQAARQQARAKGQRLPPGPKPMPWQEFGGCTPCARSARADYVQAQVRQIPSMTKMIKPVVARRPSRGR